MGNELNRFSLAKLREARSQSALRSLSILAGDQDQRQFDAALEECTSPRRRDLAELSDEELAEILATESPKSYLHPLAASILRSRESWRGPARWALILSFFSFAVAATALWLSFHRTS